MIGWLWCVNYVPANALIRVASELRKAATSCGVTSEAICCIKFLSPRLKSAASESTESCFSSVAPLACVIAADIVALIAADIVALEAIQFANCKKRGDGV